MYLRPPVLVHVVDSNDTTRSSVFVCCVVNRPSSELDCFCDGQIVPIPVIQDTVREHASTTYRKLLTSYSVACSSRVENSLCSVDKLCILRCINHVFKFFILAGFNFRLNAKLILKPYFCSFRSRSRIYSYKKIESKVVLPSARLNFRVLFVSIKQMSNMEKSKRKSARKISKSNILMVPWSSTM